MNKDKIGDGGPAFPTAGGIDYDGMTLRDYFAAQALAGHTSVELWTVAAGDGIQIKTLAQSCYDIAEAMIARRNK